MSDDLYAVQGPGLNPLDFLSGGGDMGGRIRDFDWSTTCFGPRQSWPQSLRSAIGICLNAQFPIAIYWGEKAALLYNDAWSPIPGKKHPWALGRPGQEVWPEIWNEIGPLFDRVHQTGQGVWLLDHELYVHRHGYTEECYFNYTLSPIRGEDGQVAGIFNAVIETTFRVIEERRNRLLQGLAERALSARSVEDVCRQAANVLSGATRDVPFCLFYLLDGGGHATLAARAGFDLPEQLRPEEFGLDDPRAPWSAAAADPAQVRIIDDLGLAPGQAIYGPDWPEPVTQAMLLPLRPRATAQGGFLVVGVSPRRSLDPAYRRYFERIAAQVSTAISDAQAYEVERQRAEALAQIDRAKTAFFSNVSHEFRTPLTLMLGPIEQLLADTTTPVQARERLDLAHRNALRLQKLVNSLLDFSRIEAGRVQASFEPVDLATLTGDLASTFRSLLERAGLVFEVTCPALAEPVYVDRDMWEKIVLNLLSNAFKFTFSGRIEVQLDSTQSHAVLEIRDTGVGVPSSELPHLFERFYRVEGTRGRTHEGSGIGLALVQELVKLHGGAIKAESELGRGSRFRVEIPLGCAHLSAEQIKSPRSLASTATVPEAYVQEALRWLPGASPAMAGTLHGDDTRDLELDPRLAETSGACIVLADDNADMRAYLHGLLSRRYTVEAVSDGEQALAAVRRNRPDLLISDVMMPRLDGFKLLQKLRADKTLQDIPVILLSARAGEDCRIEGLGAGADDYLIKPFSARELLARVGACLMLARVRQQAAEAFQALSHANRLARMGQLTASIAHEVNQPITATVANAHAALRWLGAQVADLDEARQALARIVKDGKRAGDIITRIRALTQEAPLPTDRLDINETIREVIGLTRSEIVKNRVTVQTDLADGLPLIEGDRVQLQQVILNLIINAIEAMSGIDERRRRLLISTARAQSGGVLVRVRDSGPGLAPATLDHLFRPFYTTKSGGLGLGLSICWSIVEAHGGHLSASPDVPDGTVFQFTLPDNRGTAPQ